MNDNQDYAELRDLPEAEVERRLNGPFDDEEVHG